MYLIGDGHFREEYSTIDNVFVLQTLICKYLSRKRGKHVVAFIDFKTAFDSVQRDKLWNTLVAVGLKRKLLKVKNGMYDYNYDRLCQTKKMEI